MRFDPAGLPFIGGALLLAFVAGAAVAWFLAIPFVALGAFFAFFFRDPERVPPTEVHAVLAPADGRVIHAGPALKESAPPGEWQQISIFLSPVDVHVNRIPVSGRVRSEEHTSELQSRLHLVCRLLLEKKKKREIMHKSD